MLYITVALRKPGLRWCVQVLCTLHIFQHKAGSVQVLLLVANFLPLLPQFMHE